MNATLSGNHTALSVIPVGGMKMGGGDNMHICMAARGRRSPPPLSHERAWTGGRAVIS